MSDLTRKRCKPCEGGVAPYNAQQVKEMMSQLKGWIVEDGKLRSEERRVGKECRL